MLRSILSLTVRHFFRNLYFSVITLGSLVVGISVVVILFLWDRYEFGFDRQDPDAARVYTLLSNEKMDGAIETGEEFNVPLADFLAHELPEVEATTRIDNTEQQLTVDNATVRKSGIYADSSFFRVFHAPLFEGSGLQPLPGNRSIAISEELALLLFRDTQALGKHLTLDGKREFQVTSIFKTFPRNSHLSYIHYILPFHAIPRQPDEWVNYYVKLYPSADKVQVEHKIDGKLKQIFGNDKLTSFLHALTDWRLHWNFENGKPTGGRIVYVMIFNITGAFILLMACINYVNLATARASRRAREIGVRKVTGATQRALVKQFLVESLTLSGLASLLSVLMVILVLPLVREFLGIPLFLEWSDPMLLVGIVVIAAMTGLIAGTYPAFLLSAVRPAVVLKGNTFSTLTGAAVRKALVTFQFALSIGLVFVALLMWRQTNFLLKRDVGYDKHNVINVWFPTDVIRPQEALKTELARHPSVKAVAFGGASPMEINGYSQVKWPGMSMDKPTYLFGVTVDFDMIPTLGMKLVAGRNFSPSRPSDSTNFIINRKAAEVMGLENPLGQQISYNMYSEQKGEIIGVIEDFNNDDIHLPVAPVVFIPGKSSQLFNLFIRYEEGQAEAAVDNLKKVFARLYPGINFTHTFLDDDFEMQMYREIFLGKISAALTVIAIFIAILGLLGLTLFSVERRTKEVAIRKVLGATVRQVLMLFLREFFRPALLSIVIALPVGYLIIQKYLESFAYRVPITAMTFLSIAAGAMVIIVSVVSFHTYRSAVTNPVEALKWE
ncbi:MAG: ABC transporter permease [Cyclobacteriaceae bacterium]|nr:ABC transporter permease [Cyclobacteriaceae bacterium]